MTPKLRLIYILVSIAVTSLVVRYCTLAEVGIDDHGYYQYNTPMETAPQPESEKLREDVSAWIDQNFGNGDPKKLIALKKLALAHQYLLAHPEDTSTREVWRRISSATTCYSMVFDYEEIDDVEVANALAARIFNTVERSHIRIEWNNRLAGQVIKPIRHEKWEGHCDDP